MTYSAFDRWLVGAGGLMVLLATATVLNFLNTRRLNDDAHLVTHTHEVMDRIEETSSHLWEAEAAQRTFVIVGGADVPPSFAANIAAARKKLGDVETLTA